MTSLLLHEEGIASAAVMVTDSTAVHKRTYIIGVDAP